MDSKTYWEKREAANLVSNLKKEKAYERELERIYRDMLDGVQKEIESFYARYADKEGITIAEARKAVSQLDIEAYERKAKRYVKDKDMSKIANEEMRLYNLTMKVNRLEMLKANIGLELIKGHAELEKFMGDILQGRTEEELRRQAGILGKTIRNNAQLAHSIVNASYHNATFSQRVWMYHGQMKADLGKMLENGLIQGKGVRQLTKELRKYYIGEPTLKNGRDGAEFAAERLMRTELARVQTDAQKQSFEKNGFGQYKFIVNSGCCAECKRIAEENDGVYDVADMMPGTNAPPVHPMCRCSTAAYEDSAEYEAWLDYLDKGGTTEEWNKKERSNWKDRFEKAGKNDKMAPDAQETKLESENAETPKTIAEAETAAKKYADNVSLKGANDIERVNVVNRTLDKLTTKYPTNKLQSIETNSKIKAYAQSNYRALQIRTAYLNDTHKKFDWATRQKNNADWIKKYEPCLNDPRYKKSHSKIRKTIKEFREEAKYKRWDVSGEDLTKCITHEYGHIIANQYFGQSNNKRANSRYEKNKYNKLYQTERMVFDTYRKAQSNGDIYKLSMYANKNEKEFFAETFTMYEYGEELPDYITEMLEKVLTNGIL